MKNRRAIVVAVTFLAGLYFILDFIVPPTLPGLTAQGVVVATKSARFSARSGVDAPVQYDYGAESTLRPQILVAQRDELGAPHLASTPLRQVAVGEKVTIRVGPFMVAQVNRDGILTSDGGRIVLAPGQVLVDPSSNAVLNAPAAGKIEEIEQRDAVLTSISNGSVALLQNGRITSHPLGAKTALIKVARYGQGDEVQLHEVRAGDTIRMGPATTFADNRDTASQFNTVLTTMAFGIGLLSLGSVHGRTLLKRPPGWSLSIFFFLAILVGAVAGIGKYEIPGTSPRDFSDFVVLRLIASVTSSVFSLLAFYLAAAAYRAFRVRTAEAGLMMTSALIVMLGQTPFGFYLTSWMGERFNALWLPNMAAWILRVPNTAVFRAFIFGIMLGAIATAIRYWLSMERSVSAGD